ncbi:MAG TPA: D-alanyl-D-alanine carboxypeptidase, partial [Bacillota bacterium]|nr:D-alanyl-D-alanine carboxypeptidase [Bacillota bacterium]
MKYLPRFALAVALATLLAWPPAFAATQQPAKKPAAKSAPAKSAAAKSASPTRPARTSIARNPYLGAIVVDASSGKVLVEDNADVKGYPASVLKLMDLLIILDKIQAQQLSLQDQVTASARA